MNRLKIVELDKSLRHCPLYRSTDFSAFPSSERQAIEREGERGGVKKIPFANLFALRSGLLPFVVRWKRTNFSQRDSKIKRETKRRAWRRSREIVSIGLVVVCSFDRASEKVSVFASRQLRLSRVARPNEQVNACGYSQISSGNHCFQSDLLSLDSGIAARLARVRDLFSRLTKRKRSPQNG